MVNATSNLYDLTNLSNTNDLAGFVTEVNHLSGDIFILGVLIVGFIIFFVSMINFGTRQAIVGSSFMISIISILFFIIDWLDRSLMILVVVMFGLVVAFTIAKSE